IFISSFLNIGSIESKQRSSIILPFGCKYNELILSEYKMNLSNTLFYSLLCNFISTVTKRLSILIFGKRNSRFFSFASSSENFDTRFFSPQITGTDEQQKALLPLVPVLRNQRKELIEVSGETEEEFLSIGAKLQDFSSRAKSLSERSAHIARLFGESKGDNSLDQAGRVAEETLINLKMFDDETNGATSKINSMVVKLNMLAEHEREFNVISRTLRILGINIKIHGAQIREGRGNSNFLADKVSELSRQSDVIVNKLFDYLDTTNTNIAIITGKIDQHVQNHRGQAAQAERRINNTLGRLRKTFDLSGGLSANINSLSSEISERVGEVVISMQFHDISRQKMEHVAEAMEDICGRIEEEDGFDKDCRPHLAAYVSRVSAVQISQLDLVAQEIEDAEKKMIAALEKITRRIADQSEEISRTVGSSGTESDDSIIVQFRSEISSLISALSQKTEIKRHILEKVKMVSKTVKEVSSFIKDVEHIAENIKLLALNAQIEAEHIGKTAPSLGALANEVRDISAQSNQVVGKVSTGINTILEIMTDLETRIGVVFAKGKKDAENLQHKAAETERGLNSLNKEMLGHIAEVDDRSKKLALDIFALTSEIQFSRKMIERIADIKETMRKLIEKAGQYHVEKEVYLDKPALDGLSNRYTMESERIIHENTFHSSPMEAGDGIAPQRKSLCCGDALDESHLDKETNGLDLFEDFNALEEQSKEAEIPREKKGGDGDDLGDNIELF
ncbi:MAG: methyl-accepting chemotaxis protein, partial [Thermodesulfobacteriota bacterium]|nr:methyl-accepting chemotaxis protein [Thermodesulfobacteriota bacterium]